MIKKRLKIISVTGFAHLASLIVSDSSKFNSTIILEYKGIPVNLKNSIESIRNLLALRIKAGTYIEIYANGCDEHKALQTIENSLCQTLCIEPEEQGKCEEASKDLFSACNEIVFKTKVDGHINCCYITMTN